MVAEDVPFCFLFYFLIVVLNYTNLLEHEDFQAPTVDLYAGLEIEESLEVRGMVILLELIQNSLSK